MKKYENIEVVNVKWMESDALPKVVFDTEEDFIRYLRSENIPCVFHFSMNGGDEIVDKEDIENKIKKLEEFYRFDVNLYKDICKSEIEAANQIRVSVVSGIMKMIKEPKDKTPVQVYCALKGNLCAVFYEHNEALEEDDIDETIDDLKYEYEKNISALIEKMQKKLNDYYKNNKKQIKHQIEKIVLNDDFMKLSTKNGRKLWFKDNVDDEVLLQYPLLTDTLNLIYEEHKDEFKRR